MIFIKNHQCLSSLFVSIQIDLIHKNFDKIQEILWTQKIYSR